MHTKAVTGVSIRMKKSSKKLAKYLRSSQRLRYPDDEARYPWLSILLDTYHIIDAGTSIELKEEELKRGVKVTCSKGCSNCCLRPMVPITEPEIWGISWFASEKLTGNVREAVSKQLLHHTETTQCPFLVDTICSIYPVRPIACRIFFMFGVSCKPNENVADTRMHDVWTHSKDVARLAAMTMLPLFGITGKREKITAFEEGYIHDASSLMHELSWKPVYDTMEKFTSIK